MNCLQLTVREVLKHKCFATAEVIAGHLGLERNVRWIHVMEVTEIGQLLSGNELILSTGIGWSGDQKERSLRYLKQLMDAGAAGLCVELGKYAQKLSQEMLDLADKFQFPIIVFHEEVRFIDITQMINTKLMNIQARVLSDLEEFSSILKDALLQTDALHAVLNLLSSYIDADVLYLAKNREKLIFRPMQTKQEQKRLLELVIKEQKARELVGKQPFLEETGSYASQTIQVLGFTYAELFIFAKEGWIGKWELLLLEQCTRAISQNLLKHFYIEEQKKSKEKQFLHEWLTGERHEKEILQYLTTAAPFLKPNGAVVCTCVMDEKLRDSTFDSYYLPFFKNIFQNQNLYLFSMFEREHLIFIIVNLREDDWKVRVKNALNQIRQTDLFQHRSKKLPIFGVGKYLTLPSIAKLSESFLTAKESLKIQSRVNMPSEYFFENLHIYRLVSMFNQNEDLLDYIHEYIGPIVQYDQKHNSELLHTLSVLLESNGSKKDAAKRLFIVRQTLYHRLEKLKDLLGEDYMEPTKRAAIEFSLYAYRYLNSTYEKEAEIRAIQ
ncbi:PucR family transcriptional regulator [Cytobacillus sp. Hz8]|uniref:PucR family transcriptional regulator n=1 Tax=Cytobacillus sp. Hz8 TaxID=3347168 RepID=UPI0035DEB113